MMRTRLRKIVDPLLALVVVTVATTGLLAARSGGSLIRVHMTAAFLFVILLVVHVSLNWPMVRANYRRKAKPKNTGG